MRLCKVIFTTAFCELGNFSKNVVLINFSRLHCCIMHIIIKNSVKFHVKSVLEAYEDEVPFLPFTKQPFTFRSD